MNRLEGVPRDTEAVEVGRKVLGLEAVQEVAVQD